MKTYTAKEIFNAMKQAEKKNPKPFRMPTTGIAIVEFYRALKIKGYEW